MKTTLYPGWQMTEPQHDAYFRLLSQVYAALGLTSRQDQELQRKIIHQSAYGHPVSAKDIDRLKGFDDFKRTCLAILQPANLQAQLDIQNMPRTRLIYAIRQLADEPYIAALAASDRFKRHDWPAMPLPQMEALRQTLADRAVAQHRGETVASRRQQARQRRQGAIANPEARINFPASEFEAGELPAANPCERCGSECNPETGECEECTERRSQARSADQAEAVAAVAPE
jgi:hypothetical protein